MRSPVGAAVLAALAAVAVIASARLPGLAEEKRLDALASTGAGRAVLEAGIVDAELAHRLNPLAVEPLFTAAALAERAGDSERSLELLRQATEIQPDNRLAWNRLIDAFTQRGNLNEVANAYVEAVRTDPILYLNPGVQLRAGSFSRSHPPSLSPSAVGTPPP